MSSLTSLVDEKTAAKSLFDEISPRRRLLTMSRECVAVATGDLLARYHISAIAAMTTHLVNDG
jgi:hypothetical protein